MSVAQKMTADEFLLLSRDARYWTRELIDGELVVNAPSKLHQYVLRDLVFALESWRRAEPARGEVMLPLDIRLDDRNVYEPDAMWYRDGRAPQRDGDAGPSPTPDIAIEVRSRSTWRKDRTVKKAMFEQHGLPELWLVDTVAERFLVSRRSSPTAATFDIELTLARSEKLTSPLLPGFALALEDLFGD